MYEIILYDTEDGKCPVREFLDSLEPKLLAKTNGTRNPSLSMVKKLAQGLGMQLKLEFIPTPAKK